MKLSCDRCGKEFRRRTDLANKSKRLGKPMYCSHRCAAIVRNRNRVHTKAEHNKADYNKLVSLGKKISEAKANGHDVKIVLREVDDEQI